MSVYREASPAETIAGRIHVPLWLLALLTFSGTLAMHIFVPALPLAAADLATSTTAMQMTVSVYIMGLAFGQLVYGPLADRFGRRPVLMIGLVIYTAGGLGALLAPSLQALVVARLFQALGGCAGLVLGRAIVRDIAMPEEAARRLALMNLMVTLGPGAAPIIGGLIGPAFGWRSIFLLLTGLGIANFLLAWLLLPETGNRLTAQSGGNTLARNYALLLRSPAFLGYALGGGCATTSMYAFIACAPFIFGQQLHRPTHEIGFYLAVLISGVWLGSMLTSRLISRIPLGRLMVGANALSVLAAAALLIGVAAGHLTLLLAVSTMFLFTLGAGVASPAALTQAVSVNPAVIGSASGLYGFAQMAIGALCTALAGMGANPALAAATVLVSAGAVAQLSFWIALHTQKAR